MSSKDCYISFPPKLKVKMRRIIQHTLMKPSSGWNLTNPIVLHRIPLYQWLLSNTHSVSCQRKLVQTRPSRAQIIKLGLELESRRRSANWTALQSSNQVLCTSRAKTGNLKQSGTWTDQATAVKLLATDYLRCLIFIFHVCNERSAWSDIHTHLLCFGEKHAIIHFQHSHFLWPMNFSVFSITFPVIHTR